ncbi:MAG TPA: 4'-phosphopantetheinyl transferase superfamily protein [Draconibacterium sp.]|nr:4'-phosphopantetheinyl transferase superfamily protein [Draconibacterium sp.]
MGWVKTIETQAGVLGIWELNDSPEELQAVFHFTDAENEAFGKMKFEKRKKEFLAVRLLTEQLIHTKPEIVYDKVGCPRLKKSQLNISISHSNELVTVLLSDKKIGIDVENTLRSVEKVARRFLSEDELKYVNKQENTRAAMVFCWSVKEAVFKCSGLQNILFNRDIIIHPERNNDEMFYAELIKGRNKRLYKCGSFLFKNNVIVYCVEEESKISTE